MHCFSSINSCLRKLILSIVCIVSITPLFAQVFEGGLLAGFNGSQIRGHQMSNGFKKFGLLGGAWVQANVNENFYWNMELKFSQKGLKINPTVKNGGYLYVYQLNYIDMPVVFGYRASDIFSLFAGLSFNYLISSSARDNYGKVNYDTGPRTWEIGALTGLRVNFTQLVKQPWAENFKLDFRYQFSALPIYTTNNKLFYYSPYSQFNSVVSTALYYTIEWP